MAQSPKNTSSSLEATWVDALFLCIYWLFLSLLVILPVDAYLTLRGSGFFLSQIVAVEAALLLIVFLIARQMRTKQPMRAELPISWQALVPLVVLFVVAMGAALLSPAPGSALREALKIPVYLVLFALGSLARSVPNARRHILTALLIGIGLVTVEAIINTTHGLPDILGTLLNIQRNSANLPFSTTTRFESTFRYPNELAAYLLIVGPILLVHALRATKDWLRVTLIIALLADFWMLVFTYTRGALLAGVAVALVLVALLGGWRLAALVLIALSLGTVGVALHGGGLSTRLASIFSGNDSGYQSRDIVRNWALQAFWQHPLLGVGLGNLKELPNAPYVDVALGLRAQDAENLYLNVLAETGLLGFVAFIAALLGGMSRLWQGIRQRSVEISTWNIGITGALGALLLYGFVDPIIVSGQITGLLCALVGFAGIATLPEMSAQRSSEGQMSDAATLALAAVNTRRLVFLVNAPGFGGANLHALRLAEALHKSGEDVLIIAPPRSATAERADTLGLPLQEAYMGLNVGRGKGWLGIIAYYLGWQTDVTRQLILRLSRERPTLFMCPFPREQVLVAQMQYRWGVQAIWIVHAPFRYAAHRLLFQRLWLKAAPQAEAVIAVSEGLGTQLKQLGVPVSRLRVIPNAVDVPPLDQGQAMHTPTLRIGVASRLVKDKGIQVLIAAMPQICRQFPQARLVIAGSGSFERDLRVQVNRLGLTDRVDFVGFVSDVPDFLRSLNVYVHPTIDAGEVIPTSILEAASVGVPVVASNLASIPEEVQDGQTGILVPPKNAAALSAAVIALLSDPARAQAMGRAGHDLVASAFSQDAATKAYESLIRRLVVRRRERGALSGIITRPYAVLQRNTLLGNSTLVLISRLLTAAATAIWTVLAARTLLPAQFGILALASGMVDTTTSLVDIGVTSLATRDLAVARAEDIHRILGNVLYLKALLGLAGIGIVLLLAGTLPFPAGTLQVMLVFGPSIFFASLTSLNLIFRARARYGYLLLISLILTVVGIGTAVIAVFLLGNAVAFALAQTETQIVGALVTLVLCVGMFGPDLRPHFAEIRRFMGRALPIGLAIAVNILYYRIDVPLLGLLTSSQEVAKYSSTYSFLDLLTLLPASLQAVTLPQMAILLKRSLGDLRDYAQQYLEIAAAIGLFIGVLLNYAALPLLHLLYGGRYDGAANILQVLAWAGAATLVTNVFVPLSVTLSRNRLLLYVSVVGLVVNVGFNVFFIPRFGALAAAFATLTTEVIVTFSLALVLMEHIRWRPRVLRLGGYAALTAFVWWLGEMPFFQSTNWLLGTALLAIIWLAGFMPLFLIERWFGKRRPAA